MRAAWFRPGLYVKRWLLLIAAGGFLASGGIWSLLGERLTASWAGGLLIAGLLLAAWALQSLISQVRRALMGRLELPLVELLWTHRHHPTVNLRIVAIGGGTGLASLLRGLKRFSRNITAVVTVTDDGGSSGRLRRELGILPPGDLRNCLTALADEERLLTELFSYRFEDGTLGGHSFGNLFLAAMAAVTGDFEKGIKAANRVLAVNGEVLPASLASVTLGARLTGGEVVIGESAITGANGQVEEVFLQPVGAHALPEAVQRIRDADVILIGPGSLYTSIIPNLLFPEVARALKESRAPRLYICNVMTQPGETTGYKVSDHVRAVFMHAGGPIFSHVLVNSTPPKRLLEKYEEHGQSPVEVDKPALSELGVQVVEAGLIDETDHVRHDPQRLAEAVIGWLYQVYPRRDVLRGRRGGGWLRRESWRALP